MSLNDLSFERKKSSMSDWRSKLASKFNRNKDYEVLETDGDRGGVNIESYRKTSDEFGEPLSLTAPKTEPPKRRSFNTPNGSAIGAIRGSRDELNKTGGVSSSKRLSVGNQPRGIRGSSVVENGRRVSLI